jgi:hypothetical protein
MISKQYPDVTSIYTYDRFLVQLRFALYHIMVISSFSLGGAPGVNQVL